VYPIRQLEVNVSRPFRVFCVNVYPHINLILLLVQIVCVSSDGEQSVGRHVHVECGLLASLCQFRLAPHQRVGVGDVGRVEIPDSCSGERVRQVLLPSSIDDDQAWFR
jgi:hypothetical protein